jgi:hypothetical protein
MSDAATQKGVAEMSDAEMVNSLAAMFDVQDAPSDEREDEEAVEEVKSTAESDDDTSEETEADEDTEVEADDQQDDEDAESSDDDKWTPKSLDELADALEMKPDEVASTLKVKIKVDGQEGEATLKDVIKSYQLEKTLNGRLEAHANERKQFEAQSTQIAQSLQERLNDVESTANALEQMLFADYQGINWNELRADDPTEYVLKQQEMRDRYSAIQQVKTKLTESQSKESETLKQQQQQNYQQYLISQRDMLLEKIPDWKDPDRVKTDMTALQAYMVNHMGVSEQELPTITDHRAIVAAYKAMMYDQMHSKVEPKMKQMKTKPKFVKPGTRKDASATSEKRKQSAMSRAKNLQTDDAWTEALLAKLS